MRYCRRFATAVRMNYKSESNHRFLRMCVCVYVFALVSFETEQKAAGAGSAEVQFNFNAEMNCAMNLFYK